MKKLLKIIGGIFLVLIVIGVIGSMGKSGSSTSTSQSGTGSKQEEAKPIAKVGETVQDGDIAFTVTDVTTATSLGNQYTKKDAQGLFYVISLKIENKAKENICCGNAQNPKQSRWNSKC
jgi:predicted deacylase